MTAAAPAPAPAGEAPVGRDPAPDPGRPLLLPPGVAATAAAAGAATLAVTSTGSMVVAAVLLAVAVTDLRSGPGFRGVALVLAVASVAVRFSTVTFDDLAGIQSVLGAAGIVGPPTGAASAWLAATAVVLALRRSGAPVTDGLVVVAGGALAAVIAAGPGPSELGLRIGATLVGALAAIAVLATDRWPGVRRLRPVLAVALGAAAVVAAAWPS